MIFKTEGLVLRVAPFSRTSHTVLWLTPDRGKLATLVKGAQRAKSPFLGQYDLFYTCEILYYRRERTGLHLLKECTPENTRPHFRSDWRAFVIAAYFSDLAARLCPPESPHPDVYKLMEATLDALATPGRGWPLVFWFELQLLGMVGLGPQLDRCLSCGRPVDLVSVDQDRCWFSPTHGGLLCNACAAGAAGLMSAQLQVVEALRNWRSTASPRQLVGAGVATEHLVTIRDLLGRFLTFHVDPHPDCREFGLRVLPVLSGAHSHPM